MGNFFTIDHSQSITSDKDVRDDEDDHFYYQYWNKHHPIIPSGSIDFEDSEFDTFHANLQILKENYLKEAIENCLDEASIYIHRLEKKIYELNQQIDKYKQITGSNLEKLENKNEYLKQLISILKELMNTVETNVPELCNSTCEPYRRYLRYLNYEFTISGKKYYWNEQITPVNDQHDIKLIKCYCVKEASNNIYNLRKEIGRLNLLIINLRKEISLNVQKSGELMEENDYLMEFSGAIKDFLEIAKENNPNFCDFTSDSYMRYVMFLKDYTY